MVPAERSPDGDKKGLSPRDGFRFDTPLGEDYHKPWQGAKQTPA